MPGSRDVGTPPGTARSSRGRGTGSRSARRRAAAARLRGTPRRRRVAVEPMSPRLPSTITSSSAVRAYAQTSSNARMPSAPSASKNASCGLTATAYGATASTIPRQKRATASAGASPRSSTGKRSTRGSSPTQSWLRFRSTAAARRSENATVATRTRRSRSAPWADQAYAPRPTAARTWQPQVVTPREWGAAPTRVALPPRGPLDHLVLHHTAYPTSRVGKTFEAEAAHMRQIQQWHFARGWATVGYHFVVSPTRPGLLARPPRPPRGARARPQCRHGRDRADGELRARASDEGRAPGASSTSAFGSSPAPAASAAPRPSRPRGQRHGLPGPLPRALRGQTRRAASRRPFSNRSGRFLAAADGRLQLRSLPRTSARSKPGSSPSPSDSAG